MKISPYGRWPKIGKDTREKERQGAEEDVSAKTEGNARVDVKKSSRRI